MIGAVISATFGKVQSGSFDHKLVALGGVILFTIFAITFLEVFSNAVYRVLAIHRLGAGRAGAIRFLVRLIGYVAIILVALALLDIPVGRLLVGGAAIGIILGVAAQQALGNFFASIVLIVVHPFSTGQLVSIKSGALGGEYEGTISDIGLTHTHLITKDGTAVALPLQHITSST
jgi:small-conductance mechanosensitive channel